MASAARPRPRPRARVKSAEEATSSTANGPSPAVPVVVDDDDMFIRKRNPVAWRKFEQENKAPAKQKAARSDSENDSDSPRPRKQKKKSGGDPAQAKINRLMSETLSEDSDSDSDIEVLRDASTPMNKRKKRRSRSRSITPPPPVPKHQVQAAKDLVRRTLAAQAAPRTPSPPPDADESTDTIILDPELQEIADLAAARAHRSFSEPVESESTETLEITVKWMPHPLNESRKSTESVFKLNRTDNFRDLFEAVADDESILVESLSRRRRSTCGGDAELMACDKTTWDYIRANPATSTNPVEVTELSDDSDDEPSIVNPNANTQESDAESDAGGETFKLVLQSAITKNITVTVRPTTTCGAIVQAFLKKAGLADKYNKKTPRQSLGGTSRKGKKAAEPEKNPHLVIDGDNMAPHVPIGDMDLEDGDTVDVVGL
ncbi:hypothetical protein MVEN_00369300 [Mycena venus]|uniref:Rad60/SUMO-like domain-containing protein n=1 Tax=Mycena venus TaxID=2733690 RepID=A0A8H6YUN8_9AGAR|nr:hypothetical protein MVEN_00369300 [Mycena venus]